jgi:uncharacterized glyoxalase superfamily protein PhnB
MSWLNPYLTVKDPTASLDFFKRAFGFEEKMVMKTPDGQIVHAEVTYHDIVIMFGPEGAPGNACRSPNSSGVLPPIGLYLYCDDVDAAYARATKAGAKGDHAPQDMFYGDRVCKLTDPDGFIWSFATNVADFDPSKAPY